MSREYKSHQIGDSKDAIVAAIPPSPMNGNGPQRKTIAGQIIESGLSILPGFNMCPFREDVSVPTSLLL
jgi:hypothetical protein